MLQMSKIIAVTSGKAGTGKSTVSANVASALAAAGKRTIIVELGQSLRCQDIMLGIGGGEVKHDMAAYLSGEVELLEATVSVSKNRGENLELICAALQPQPLEKLDSAKVIGVCEELREHFEYIVIDTASSGSMSAPGSALGVAKIADVVLIVTTPDADCVSDCAALSDLLMIRGCEKQYLLINKATPEGDFDAVMDEAGIPLIGVLPADNDIKICNAKGIPLPIGSYSLKEFRGIAGRLLGEYVPLTIKEIKIKQ
jgi:septum site-determining protein MinD